MRYLGIIGYPLGHSISPAFQQAALDHLGLAVRYQVWETPPEELGRRVEALRRPEYLGANVTVPHKERVLPLLDRVEETARAIGAVNTIVAEGDALVGHNTDVEGFIASLRAEASFDPRDKRALLLGAGGAARAVAYGLATEGVASLVIANRTLERAQALARELEGRVPEVAAVPLEPEATGEAAQRADLIVNTTSVGMRHGPAEGRSPLEAGQVPTGALVCDIVYNPPETPLLREAARAGARTLGGLPMLVYQGAAAFRLWTGRQAPINVMFRAARRALGTDPGYPAGGR